MNNKLCKFEKLYFNIVFKNNLKNLKFNKCCNCNKKLEEVKLISNCYHCKKNFCFKCCNELFFNNYFIMPDKNINDFIIILFHTVDRHYFNDMCCSKNYYLNFIPNKFEILSICNKYEHLYRTLKKLNLNLILHNKEIQFLYLENLKLLYKYTNIIFWNTYLLIKFDIPLDIIFLIYNINFIKYKY